LVKIAFTLDDLPLWPQSYPPKGYTAAGIVRAISGALREHGIAGVYSFSNSWPLDPHPEMARILDDWVAEGHHVANHTHSHLQLPDVTADTFIADIDKAQERLAPWMTKAPLQLFRHPLCHWGETAEKLLAVNRHLRMSGLTPVDVTSWSYEWTWNRAYRNALEADDKTAQKFLRDSFLDFSLAQLRHDMETNADWFGSQGVGIALGHNVPFFADIASEYFGHLIAAGVQFVPLQEALTGRQQEAVGSVVSADFLVLQQKLAKAAGRPVEQFPPGYAALHARIVDMARGQTG